MCKLISPTMQVFLLFCMSVTLYFAEEIPLEPTDAQRLSDSAPLLNGSRDDNNASNEPRNGALPNGHTDGSNVPANSNAEDSNSNRENVEVFNDGPGAVLVNILTSMRHLPPGMYSVLLVMALTWVCYLKTSMHVYQLHAACLLLFWNL